MRDTIEMAREADEYADMEWPLRPRGEGWQKCRDERFETLARADEREAIKDEWWMCVQSDLENGVKSLNEQAAIKWRKEYPEIAKFGAWLNERGETK
jgi:transposase-like protein